jgi:hypothetical protein
MMAVRIPEAHLAIGLPVDGLDARVALRHEERHVAVVLPAVHPLLTAEAAHLLEQLGVVDAVPVVLHAAHEEGLARREGAGQGVHEVRLGRIAVVPVARRPVREAEVQVPNADRCRHAPAAPRATLGV